MQQAMVTGIKCCREVSNARKRVHWIERILTTLLRLSASGRDRTQKHRINNPLRGVLGKTGGDRIQRTGITHGDKTQRTLVELCAAGGADTCLLCCLTSVGWGGCR